MKPEDIQPGRYLRVGVGPDDRKPDIAAVMSRTGQTVGIVFLDALWSTHGQASEYELSEFDGRAVLDNLLYPEEFLEGNGEKIVRGMQLDATYCADRSVTAKEFGRICENFLSDLAEAKKGSTS